MIAVLKGSSSEAKALADDHNLVVANDNAPGQVVLSGMRPGLEAARREARERGWPAIALSVAGAFHSPEMAPARQAFAAAAAAVTWSEPDAPVISGLTAQRFVDPANELVEAITAPVRWREVMPELYRHGATDFVDLGPGDVLARLVERNPPERDVSR